MPEHRIPEPIAGGPYVGRFAPSPTGPLHFGSLVAALGSFLEARRQRGRWLLRIEDIDPPREQPGAADAILRLLDVCGLHWDGDVLYQSSRSEAYREALRQLQDEDHVYPCACSRKDIQLATGSVEVYPGTCRNGPSSPRRPYALRVRVDNEPVRFTDAVQGFVEQRLEDSIGDFVVQRADGFFTYQLAVVVDDAWQNVTAVVRGADLLDNTPRQLHLQSLLHLPRPRYLHLPIVVDAHGDKLSKQTHADAISPDNTGVALWQALALLGQSPPPELRTADCNALIGWAQECWRPENIPRRSALSAPMMSK